LAPAPANAGAWIAPVDGQEIWTNVAGAREELSFFETSAYWEAPLGDSTSFLAAPWLEQNYDTIDGWRAEAVVGVKRAVFRDEHTVAALQVGALWVSHPGAECGEGGAEVRLLGGRSYENGAFLNVEAAARMLDGGCDGERVDITGGIHFAENWLALGQVFLDASSGAEETVKAQVSLVRFRQNGRGIQFGLRTRIDGGADETALVLGFWGPMVDRDD
jgi:hypothetical protein